VEFEYGKLTAEPAVVDSNHPLNEFPERVGELGAVTDSFV